MTINKELNKLDKDKLVKLICELYKKNKSVKDFFDYYFQPDEKGLFEKYRDKVFEAFYPKRGFHLKLKDAKQAISEFKKFEPTPKYLADLMLFYVECGVKFTNDYGDIDENFYNSIANMYEDALKLMKKKSLLEIFIQRTDKVVTDTRGIGWGFHDELGDINFEYHADYRDDAIESEEYNSESDSQAKIIPLSNKVSSEN